jgi:hypothetical protein
MICTFALDAKRMVAVLAFTLAVNDVAWFCYLDKPSWWGLITLVYRTWILYTMFRGGHEPHDCFASPIFQRKIILVSEQLDINFDILRPATTTTEMMHDVEELSDVIVALPLQSSIQ